MLEQEALQLAVDDWQANYLPAAGQLVSQSRVMLIGARTLRPI
ncbi:MAG: hypothetical protein ACOX18_03950 [Bacillota bacterium]